MRSRLPDPVTPTDRYLHDIATSLRQLVGGQEDTPSGDQVRPDAVPLREPAGRRVEHVGGGYYVVRVGGVEVAKVRGKDKAEQALREHLGSR